jgi:hypothetical protein
MGIVIWKIFASLRANVCFLVFVMSSTEISQCALGMVAKANEIHLHLSRSVESPALQRRRSDKVPQIVWSDRQIHFIYVCPCACAQLIWPVFRCAPAVFYIGLMAPTEPPVDRCVHISVLLPVTPKE